MIVLFSLVVVVVMLLKVVEVVVVIGVVAMDVFAAVGMTIMVIDDVFSISFGGLVNGLVRIVVLAIVNEVVCLLPILDGAIERIPFHHVV